MQESSATRPLSRTLEIQLETGNLLSPRISLNKFAVIYDHMRSPIFGQPSQPQRFIQFAFTQTTNNTKPKAKGLCPLDVSMKTLKAAEKGRKHLTIGQVG